jgi:hypothetical protein
MDDWDGFYTLAGSTAGTLIGLIFVVITLGIDHTKKGDEHRVRLYVTPVLVYFASLLVIAMVMVPPLSSAWRAFALGAIGSAGLAYVMNLWMLSHRVMRFETDHLACRGAACVFHVDHGIGGGLRARSALRQRAMRARRGHPARDLGSQHLDGHPRHRQPPIAKQRGAAPAKGSRLLSIRQRLGSGEPGATARSSASRFRACPVPCSRQHAGEFLGHVAEHRPEDHRKDDDDDGILKRRRRHASALHQRVCGN